MMKSLKIKAILVITANFTKLATFTTSTTTNATTTATTRVNLNDDPLNEKLLANYQHRNSECH